MVKAIDVWNPLGGIRAPLGETMGWPAVDVEETEKAYEITAELPGIDKEDLRVDILDEGIRIAAQTTTSIEHEEEGRRELQSRSSSFSRFLALQDMDAENVQGSYRDGLLRLHVPKLAETNGRRLEIG